MSFYEKATLLCSAIAILLSILIPLVQFIISKSKRLKLSTIPFENNSLYLFFNECGSYFKFSFCISCQNRPATISSIHAKIVRKSDGTEKLFNWSTLESVYVNWFGINSANRINSVSYARPCKINADTLEPFIVEFANTDADHLQELCAVRDQQLLRYVQFGEKQINSVDDLRKTYTVLDEYRQLCKNYNCFLFWLPGEYELSLTIKHDVKKEKIIKYNFSISENEYSNISKNEESIIFNQLYKHSNQQPLSFYSIPKTL